MAKTLHSKRQEVLVAAIAEQRRAKGLSQAQVAKALDGTNRSSPISESGERRVDLLELLTLANIIELDVHALIDRLKQLRTEVQLLYRLVQHLQRMTPKIILVCDALLTMPTIALTSGSGTCAFTSCVTTVCRRLWKTSSLLLD